jgi:hypothetical protein
MRLLDRVNWGKPLDWVKHGQLLKDDSTLLSCFPEHSIEYIYIYILFIIKPTRFTNSTNLFWHETIRFGQVCPSSGVHSLYTQQWYMSYRFVDSFRAGTGCHPGPPLNLSTNLYDIYHCWVYSEWTPDDGQTNCPKHVEFYSKNKFEKLVHLVGFIIRKFVTMHGQMNVISHSGALVTNIYIYRVSQEEWTILREGVP